MTMPIEKQREMIRTLSGTIRDETVVLKNIRYKSVLPRAFSKLPAERKRNIVSRENMTHHFTAI